MDNSLSEFNDEHNMDKKDELVSKSDFDTLTERSFDQPYLSLSLVEKYDPEISNLLFDELDRQRSQLEMIASENFTSLAVMQTQGTWLTNKYAEGTPNKRYYGGCVHVDKIESIAKDRALELFGAEHANVQPHSGSQANTAVFFSCLSPGDTIMGMNLSHGGHLTHGSPVNISGKYYNVVSYGVDKEKERINYDEIEKIAKENSPKMIIAGASSYPRIIDFERLGHIAKSCNACFFVDMSHIAGLVATGLHPSPINHADVVTTTTHKTLRGPRGGVILCKKDMGALIDKAVFPGTQGGPLMHVIAAKAVAFKEALEPSFVEYQRQVIDNAKALATCLLDQGLQLVSGGTDNHIVLVDLTSVGLTGKEAEEVLESVGITVNKNTIPFDPLSPMVTSGIRIGTPALTSRGMNECQMSEIGKIIKKTFENRNDTKELDKIKSEVGALSKAFPLYPELQFS